MKRTKISGRGARTTENTEYGSTISNSSKIYHVIQLSRLVCQALHLEHPKEDSCHELLTCNKTDIQMNKTIVASNWHHRSLAYGFIEPLRKPRECIFNTISTVNTKPITISTMNVMSINGGYQAKVRLVLAQTDMSEAPEHIRKKCLTEVLLYQAMLELLFAGIMPVLDITPPVPKPGWVEPNRSRLAPCWSPIGVSPPPPAPPPPPPPPAPPGPPPPAAASKPPGPFSLSIKVASPILMLCLRPSILPRHPKCSWTCFPSAGEWGLQIQYIDQKWCCSSHEYLVISVNRLD